MYTLIIKFLKKISKKFEFKQSVYEILKGEFCI